ncbi:MAG: transporter [Desulfobacteraceae bacterium]|nr:transporter [Desulfobacteraceae bacterium]
MRFGIANRLEGFVDVPVTWAEREDIYPQSESKNDNFGLGDMNAGLKYLLYQQDKELPDIICSLSFSAPTGEEQKIDKPDIVSLGSGHWQVSAGLTMVKAYDPAVLFGGISYTHLFDRNSAVITPGNTFSYNFGMGFAINNQITISGMFMGAYQTETEINGVRISGTSREPMSIRTGLTYRISKKHYLEPSVTFGLNDDASDAVITLSYTRKLF